MRMVARACAKINWALDVVGMREDGYHELDMLMQSVELSDELSACVSGQISLQVVGSSLPADASNLVLRAARVLQRETGCALGAELRLVKRIPEQAGMGGGSADCAAALLLLNRLWELDLPPGRLAQLGLELGADVPFCLRGGLARVQGIGERIEILPVAPAWPLVVLHPGLGLPTGRVFQAWDRCQPEHPSVERMERALRNGSLEGLGLGGYNALQPVSMGMLPDVMSMVEALLQQGAVFAQMTGSGSAVFGAFNSEAEAHAAAGHLEGQFALCLVTRTGASGVEVEEQS